ncbi:nitrate reductase molybdenum cofactor assembly chaperone [Nocardiopsis sp. JB363]|uniref:nitrate reductase molybdenum cofactor assembly chaperone n=1 Tax=Nocardiopsis sp. JB363 TaxID=1434837 RepID=UPI00097B269A|nr:nitrate reductase molybdenum cofactor assembly chaperone [Nocardiopsis sp. JB363]SIO88633.1 Respiratory nitrate reductase delta chain [Nocardiopsis sp. JB363]
MSLFKALRRHPITDRQRALTHRIAALVLAHPDERLLADLPMLRQAAEELPDPPRADLIGVIEWLAATPPPELAETYVGTFDLHRRSCLHLTYYAHGDTRNRGAALLSFSNAYRRAGFLLDEDELPDHLCVVLEFAATVDPVGGTRLLNRYRAGLELLHLALRDADSLYTGAVTAINATLPPKTDRIDDKVARLVAQGPPVEEVGLAPFPPPETRSVHS